MNSVEMGTVCMRYVMCPLWCYTSVGNRAAEQEATRTKDIDESIHLRLYAKKENGKEKKEEPKQQREAARNTTPHTSWVQTRCMTENASHLWDNSH